MNVSVTLTNRLAVFKLV